MFDDRIMDKLAYILDDIKRKEPEFAAEFCRQKSLDEIKSTPFNEFLKGFILSQMSAQTRWVNIDRNIRNGNLDRVFFNWDAEKIKVQSGEQLNSDLRQIKCGARPRRNQMLSLKENILMLEKVHRENGSLGNYIITTPARDVLYSFSAYNGKYKLKWFGLALCCEWLKGYIDAIKPDVHIKRILGSERLNFFTGKENDIEIIDKLLKIKSEYPLRVIDLILWEYCREDGYSGICSKTPKCNLCRIREYCNYK